MIGTLLRSDKGELKPSDLPGDTDVGGDGMEYIPHSMMVCTGFITIVGLLYSHWFCASALAPLSTSCTLANYAQHVMPATHRQHAH
jgi:hypothetical protein